MSPLTSTPTELQTETAPRQENPRPVAASSTPTPPPSPRLELTFACLLVPRFPDHALSGDLAEYLPAWLREACIAYGWRLDALVIRPGYLHWMMTMPPQANPALAIKRIRQHTSQRILEDFPRLRRQNLAGDFWAPGFYISNAAELLPPQTISDFIQTTRQQQGIF